MASQHRETHRTSPRSHRRLPDPPGGLVLISHDGDHWGFPAGRPEENEQPEETLVREVLEEACALVTDYRLLGFSRSLCIEGHERGLVLV